jgi:hypothetical protein
MPSRPRSRSSSGSLRAADHARRVHGRAGRRCPHGPDGRARPRRSDSPPGPVRTSRVGLRVLRARLRRARPPAAGRRAGARGLRRPQRAGHGEAPDPHRQLCRPSRTAAGTASEAGATARPEASAGPQAPVGSHTAGTATHRCAATSTRCGRARPVRRVAARGPCRTSRHGTAAGALTVHVGSPGACAQGGRPAAPAEEPAGHPDGPGHPVGRDRRRSGRGVRRRQMSGRVPVHHSPKFLAITYCDQP